MTRLALVALCLLILGGLGGAQERGGSSPPFGPDEDGRKSDELRLPNGKLQSQEILKSDHEKSLQDARELVELSQALEKEVELSGVNILSISSIHKTEEIEKLAKRIRSRIRRY